MTTTFERLQVANAKLEQLKQEYDAADARRKQAENAYNAQMNEVNSAKLQEAEEKANVAREKDCTQGSHQRYCSVGCDHRGRQHSKKHSQPYIHLRWCDLGVQRGQRGPPASRSKR
jgi:hypothetical protein